MPHTSRHVPNATIVPPSCRQVYVRQEDIFFSQLTVKETLLTAARLQLPDTLSDDEKQQRVEELLRQMGLVGMSEIEETLSPRQGNRCPRQATCVIMGCQLGSSFHNKQKS